MMATNRIHIQFSGSLQVDDATEIVRLLRDAITRRPANCGAVLRVKELGRNAQDYTLQDIDGIQIPISDYIAPIRSI